MFTQEADTQITGSAVFGFNSADRDGGENTSPQMTQKPLEQHQIR